MAISLSVNLNKVALLRNSRGAQNPAPLVAGRTCLDNGAYGLTLHWRADNRHARVDDRRLALRPGGAAYIMAKARGARQK